MIEICSKICWECFKYWLCAVSFIKRIVVCVRILKLNSLALQRNIFAREGQPAPPRFLNHTTELFGIYFWCFCRDSLILEILNQSKFYRALFSFVSSGYNNIFFRTQRTENFALSLVSPLTPSLQKGFVADQKVQLFCVFVFQIKFLAVEKFSTDRPR